MADDPPEYPVPPNRRPVDEPKRTDTSLLLDIKQDIGALQANVDHVLIEQHDARASRDGIHQKLDIVNATVAKNSGTLERITPIVDRLDKLDLGRVAVRNWLSKIFHSGWTAAGAGAAAVAWLAHEWDTVRELWSRLWR